MQQRVETGSLALRAEDPDNEAAGLFHGGAGRSGCEVWKDMSRVGSRMSSLCTQEHSSGP